MKKNLLIILFLSLFLNGFSQVIPRYYQSNMVAVFDSNKLQNPFGGGLQFPVFAGIDLNFDWKLDLVIIDRSDDRLLTFINTGNADSIKFEYRPQYESYFPQLLRTIIIKDYNNDGLEDIFAFSQKYNGGFEVHKNISSGNKLKFVKIIDQIKANYWGNEGSVYINSIDIPAFEDIDKDGDLDILTFSILGMYMDYFQNMSMERYQNTDSLEFDYADQCWGKFRENDTSNQLLLGKSCSPVKIRSTNTDEYEIQRSHYRHSGSTTLAIDIDNDNDFDLILGDVEYSGLKLLINGKVEKNYPNDSMIKQYDNYPLNGNHVDIKNMPAAFFIDVNNDGIKDLISSPMDEEVVDSFQNLNQVWLYINEGRNDNPDFKFVKNNFLQDQMIDLGGSTSPAFFDFDNDGDKDLFVATMGDFDKTFYKHDRIYLFENQGTAVKPEFHLINNDYLSLSQKNYKNLTLCFGDIDIDGDKDLLMGSNSGKIIFYENIANTGQTANFEFVTNYFDSIDVGYISTPCVAFVNDDNYPDLLIGERRGRLNYFKNTHSTNYPKFEFITDTFGGVFFPPSMLESVAPTVFDINKDGKDDLIFGTRSGKLYFCSDYKNDINGVFDFSTEHFFDSLSSSKILKPLGRQIRPVFLEIDGDTMPDIILGSNRGGLLFYGTQFDSINLSRKSNHFVKTFEVLAYPNPVKNILNIKIEGTNKELTIKIYDVFGKIHYNNKISGNNICRIQMNNLPQGIYFVSFFDNEKYRNKLIKIIKI